MTTGAASIHRLQATGSSAPTGRIYQPESVDRWRRTALAGATPERVKNILARAERGDTEEWADLSEYMLRTDAHLRSVYETLIRGVLSGEMAWSAGRARPGQEDAAERAVEFVADSFERVHRLDQTLEDLVHAHGVNVSVLEHQWERRDGAWHSVRQHWVPTRDIDFTSNWSLRVRSFGGTGAWEWVSLDDEPDRWLVHVPRAVGMAPTTSGLLMACAWSWLFKLWALKNGNIAVERLGLPLMVGKLGPNANETARAAMFSALENMSAGHAGIIEDDGTGVGGIDVVGETASSSAGSAHREWIGYLDDQITKAILGSTLNVDVGSTGGNRALGESQAAMTILPRLQSIAASVAESIQATWVKPLLRLNAHLFGGVMPPVPQLSWRLEQEEPPTLSREGYEVGAYTRDEVRAAAGLEPWGPERGGDTIAVPVAKSTPSFAAGDREEGDPGPFAQSRPRRRGRQMALPLTSPTSGDSRTRSDSLPPV